MTISFRDFDVSEYRKSVEAMTDDELIQEGKTMRRLSGNGRIVSTMPSAFDEQLKVCRDEWRRRHPKMRRNSTG